jgi:hypothetical protein
MVMIGLLGRLEHYRQSLRTWLLSVSWTSGNEYHMVLVFLVALFAIPVVTLDVATAPTGIPALFAEASFFFMLFWIAILLIMSVVFAPVGMLLL